jgi:hypothetical protein
LAKMLMDMSIKLHLPKEIKGSRRDRVGYKERRKNGGGRMTKKTKVI